MYMEIKVRSENRSENYMKTDLKLHRTKISSLMKDKSKT